jgi:antirestriction protein ArdC
MLCRDRHNRHWTHHPTRLDRDLGRKRFGDAGYAMEELVAEIGAAYLCADLGITPETNEDHADSIDSWLKVLGGDKRAIFTAASRADRATGHLHSYQPHEQTAAIGENLSPEFTPPQAVAMLGSADRAQFQRRDDVTVKGRTPR